MQRGPRGRRRAGLGVGPGVRLQAGLRRRARRRRRLRRSPGPGRERGHPRQHALRRALCSACAAGTAPVQAPGACVLPVRAAPHDGPGGLRGAAGRGPAAPRRRRAAGFARAAARPWAQPAREAGRGERQQRVQGGHPGVVSAVRDRGVPGRRRCQWHWGPLTGGQAHRGPRRPDWHGRACAAASMHALVSPGSCGALLCAGIHNSAMPFCRSGASHACSCNISAQCSLATRRYGARSLLRWHAARQGNGVLLSPGTAARRKAQRTAAHTDCDAPRAKPAPSPGAGPLHRQRTQLERRLLLAAQQLLVRGAQLRQRARAAPAARRRARHRTRRMAWHRPQAPVSCAAATCRVLAAAARPPSRARRVGAPAP